MDYRGLNASVSGWGKVKRKRIEGEDEYADVLQETRLQVYVSNQTIARKYHDMYLVAKDNDTSSACEGDSGGNMNKHRITRTYKDSF